MGTEGAGSTRGGGEGLHNEDAFVVEDGLGLYLVCDGASDSPAGETAARVASAAVEACIESESEALEQLDGVAARRLVERAMSVAMRAVDEAERSDPALRGLATTLTLLLVHGSLGVFGHRGDSRAYLIRRGVSHQLTIDDEWSEAFSNGHDAGPASTVFSVPLQARDTIVLCSDGAEEVVQDAAIVRAAASVGPRILASRIVSAAHARKPGQDATAVVVRVRGELEPGWLGISNPTRETAFGHRLLQEARARD